MITIIDLGVSNIKSITRGFATQGFKVRVTTVPGDVEGADSLVLPGVGAFPRAVQALKEKALWNPVLRHAASGRPLLGVCLGMQLLCASSDEHELTGGLGLIEGHVRKFPSDRPVPHMGWNEVVKRGRSVLFESVPDSADFYFVHSYYVQLEDETCEIGYSDHHERFTAAVQKGSVFGTQFHPEKSQDWGLVVLWNFARLTEK